MDRVERIEELIREAVRRAFRAGVGGMQVLTWIHEELTNEVDGGRKRKR